MTNTPDAHDREGAAACGVPASWCRSRSRHRKRRAAPRQGTWGSRRRSTTPIFDRAPRPCPGPCCACRPPGSGRGFPFRPAEFARGGEKPFLVSYRRKLGRFVDQLDVEDGLFDGSPRELGAGNAEIRELVSILRCASFQGLFVLGANNRRVGTLPDAAARFLELLDRL